MIVFALFWGDSTTREYKFDRYYEYLSDQNTVCFFMLNSVDDHYLFIGRSNKEGMSGFIYDYKAHEYHYYGVANGSKGVTFSYEDSRRLQGVYPNPYDKRIQFDYKVTVLDSVRESVKIVRYRQNRKRKDLAEVTLVYDKANGEEVFHDLALTFFSHHLFDKRRIETLNNRLPVSIAYDYYNGATSSFKLTKKQKINTWLTISKGQLKYN